jgi:hypothetical protein
MGTHTSYDLVIYHLVSLKSHFHLITSEKFQGVIKELSNHEIYPNSDNEHLPDHTQLADKLNCNQIKMNKILRDLLNNLINTLNDNPLTIKDKVHILYVSPYIEPGEQNKDWIQKQWEKSISIPLVLPVTPRIGDYIEIPLMKTSYSFSTDDKYNSGYVHEIRHTIKGTTQEILILIYPYKSFYYKWEELKKEYEDNKRWLARKEEKNRF